MERDSQKASSSGIRGQALKKVSTEARKSLEKFFDKKYTWKPLLRWTRTGATHRRSWVISATIQNKERSQNETTSNALTVCRANSRTVRGLETWSSSANIHKVQTSP